MSTIHVLPQAAEHLKKALRADGDRAPEVPVQDQPHNSDQDMMYAWSIDATHPEGSAPSAAHSDQETCPPEVYIG